MKLCFVSVNGPRETYFVDEACNIMYSTESQPTFWRNISPPSSGSKNKLSKPLCLPSDFTLVSCSPYFSTLKMVAICSSETSVDSQRTTQHYIPEDGTLHNHCCENLKSFLSNLCKRKFMFHILNFISMFYNLH
jgi:hypothetical protein